MAKTQVKSPQIEDGSITKDDLNTTTAGKAVITKLVQGTGVVITSSGVDSGTGEVTVNFKLENRTSDPASPAVGDMWLRTDL